MASQKSAASENLSITLRTMLCGGLAGSIDELLTIPMDTAKVRMMMDKDLSLTVRNMIHTMRAMYVKEGIACFYKGIIPGVQRQMIYASLRLGLFEPVIIVCHSSQYRFEEPCSEFTSQANMSDCTRKSFPE